MSKKGRKPTYGNLRHGQTGTRAYLAWSNMKTRCFNPKNHKFVDYGARGITVCERWLKFENFYEDMGQPPVGMSLELDAVNSNYEPGNCRWATLHEQARNKRRVPLINGVRVTKKEASIKLGMSKAAVNMRLLNGWTLEQAMTTPKGGSL